MPMRNALMLVGVAAALAFAGCAAPEESRSTDPDAPPVVETAVLTPEGMPWQAAPPSLPEGARVAVLSGDPARAGPFTMRAEIPAGYRIPYHTHEGNEHVTILSGTARLTFQEEFGARALPPGSFFVVAPGTVHMLESGDAPVVLQVHGEGPWDLAYEDPADDPRGA